MARKRRANRRGRPTRAQLLRLEAAGVLGGACASCGKPVTARNIARFIINHIRYLDAGEVKYSDYSPARRRAGDYMADLLPLVRADPSRFNVLCAGCNLYVTRLVSMLPRKFDGIVRLATLQRRYQGPGKPLNAR